MDQNVPFTPTPNEASSPRGIVVGIVVVIALLVIGAFYFFMQVPSTPPPTTGATTTEETAFAPVGNSDEPAAIENDLQAEDFADIDAELSEIEGEFGY